MGKVTICSFNVENLYLRYDFTPMPPGIRTKEIPEEDFVKGVGYLPANYLNKKDYTLYRDSARELTALALTRGNAGFPEICCLCEVESMQALRAFNKKYLKEHYPYCLLIDSHDMRLIDLAILSIHPITGIVSHLDEKDDRGSFLFSRDCLEVSFNIGGKPLTLFANHLKSKYAEDEAIQARGNAKRKSQAVRVAQVLRERFPGNAYKSGRFVALGDFNDSPDSEFVAPLVKDAGLENVIERLEAGERWTHWWAGKNRVSQLDYILLSPALSKSCAGKPVIERRGVSTKIKKKSYFNLPGDAKGSAVDFTFPRFPGVTEAVDASDHCPVFFDLELP